MFENLIPLILFCFGMTVTPGPNNIIMTATGANHGYRASLPHILGATLSIPVMCMMVGVGLGQLILLYPPAHTALNLAGSAYLLWLAWKVANYSGTVDGKDAGQPLTFMQAVIFQWLNPKCWMMYIGAVSMFTTSGGNVFLQVFIIAAVFTVMVPPCFSFWSLAGVGVGRFLTSPARRRAFNLSLALLLVASLVLAQLPQDGMG